MSDSRPTSVGKVRTRGPTILRRQSRPMSPRVLVIIRRLVFFCVAIAILPTALVFMGASVSRNRMQEIETTTTKEKEVGPLWTQDVHFGDATWVQSMRDRMVGRRAYFREECAKYGLDDKPGDPWEYLVSGSPNPLVWCSIFKAASTSWMYNFNILAGYSTAFLNQTKTTLLELARQRYPRVDIDTLRSVLKANDVVSFLIVRHPLERLLSAYRDKFENALPHTFHEKLGMQIVMQYRSRSLRLPGAAPPSKPRNLRQQGDMVQVKPIPPPPPATLLTSRKPTFREFVMYLVDQWRSHRRLDMHWTPINDFCTPCSVQPDIIAKFETLQEDQNYIIYLAGLQDRIRPQWRNHAKGFTKTADLVNKYYSQLMKSQILELYELYKYDFLVFGYSLDGYLDLGIPDVQTTNKTQPQSVL